MHSTDYLATESSFACISIVVSEKKIIKILANFKMSTVYIYYQGDTLLILKHYLARQKKATRG